MQIVLSSIRRDNISMALGKVLLSPVQKHWRYYSIALSHKFMILEMINFIHVQYNPIHESSYVPHLKMKQKKESTAISE